MEQIIHLFAESGEVVESNPVFMTVVFKAFDTRANKNDQRLSLDFLKRIAENPEFYAGTPVKVDANRLSREMYSKLTHLYDEDAKEFRADQIGSIQKFELREDGDGETAMYCTARIEKARSEIAEGIETLFGEGELAFSYEIHAGDLEQDGGITVVTGSEKNYLTAMCVVSVPACEDATAETLIAEAQDKGEVAEKEETQMENEKPKEGQDLEARAEQIFAQMEAPAFARALYRAAMESGELGEDWFPLAEYSDSTVFKHWDSGRMKRVYGQEAEGNVTISQVEEVEFAPVGGASTADEPPANEPEAEPSNAPVLSSEEEKDPEEKKPEDEPAPQGEPEPENQLEPDGEETPEADPAPEEEDQDKRMRELEAENERLRRRCAELEAQSAEKLKAEAEEQKQRLRAYAAERGMGEDEELNRAIDELDYKAVTQKIMASASSAQPRNPFLSDGIALNKSGTWRDYLHA